MLPEPLNYLFDKHTSNIENLNFNLYHIISLPVHINKNNFIFIQSSAEYLVVENNKQYYTVFKKF